MLHLWTRRLCFIIRFGSKILFIHLFSLFSVFVSYNSVMVFYLLHEPLNFAPTQIGYFLAEAMCLKFIGSMIIDYVLVYRLHVKDYFLIIFSFFTFGGLFLSIGLSRKEWQIYSCKSSYPSKFTSAVGNLCRVE